MVRVTAAVTSMCAMTATSVDGTASTCGTDRGRSSQRGGVRAESR